VKLRGRIKQLVVVKCRFYDDQWGSSDLK